MKPILFTQRVEIVPSYQERRDCADQRIAEFISACGFLPIPVPNCSDLAFELIRELHPTGIILTGGNSLVRYGGNAPERDDMDFALLEVAVQRRVPLYGFCRGMQSIIAYFGNEIVDVNGHVAVRHIVRSGKDFYEVNSYHNQACVRLERDSGLLEEAWSDDGVIEAIRHDKLPIMGTMWHPEREKIFAAGDIERVRKLFLG